MAAIEERLILEASVVPHWLAEGDAFWYLKHTEGGKFEFMFVEALQKSRKPAFDHRGLAKSLHEQTGEEIDPERLPFTWIDIKPDGSSVFFRYSGKTWQYGSDDTLKEAGDDAPEELNQLTVEYGSPQSSQPASVRFVNHTARPMLLYWIDEKKTPVLYAMLNTGVSKTQETYQGHVWLVMDEQSGKTKEIYAVPNQTNDVFGIRDWKQIKEPAKSGRTDKMESESKANASVTTDAVARDAEKGEKTNAKREVVLDGENLWLKEKDGSRHQLSWDGSSEYQYDDIHLSPDEKFVLAWQYTPEQEHIVHRVESSPKDQVQPRLRSRQYLKPGDRMRQDRPRLFDLDNKREMAIQLDHFTHQFSITRIGWNKKGDSYRLIFNERGHQRLKVLSISRDGTVQVVVEERSDTFIDYSSKMYWHMVDDTDEMIWASERSGYNHLYLVDVANCTIKNQITCGEWNVRSVDHIDKSSRRIWLNAIGLQPDQDPYYTHPARANFDGTEFRAFTDGKGTHAWWWSPDRRFFVDRCSALDAPPQTCLRDGETGETVVFLEGRPMNESEKQSWIGPDIFVAPGRNGKTLIYGALIRPKSFDEKKKYPVIEDIYAGPHGFFTPKEFSPLTRQRDLADEGYLIVKVDGMGTNWRSKAFHDVCYKNIRDAGFPDRIAWMRAAAATRPWMDLSRVGIFGGSAGGQNSVAALIHHGDFYKAAVADCGCHDNRMDKVWWNEQWMGYPVDKSYADSSNVVHASKLQGALMLTLGELDTNVDPASTMQLINALNEAGKEYDFVFVPGGEHGCGELPYPKTRRKLFFKRHLKPQQE